MVRIGGGPLGTPDVVSDNVSEGLGFFDRTIGEEASPDGLDASEVGGLAVPEAPIGRVRGDELKKIILSGKRKVPTAIGLGHFFFYK